MSTRHPEAVARRVGEAALEILRRGEGDRVHEHVELARPRLRRPRRRRARRPRPSERRRTSRAGEPTEPASSRTLLSIRSPWNVKASSAPSAASRRAIAHAIERLFATPRIERALALEPQPLARESSASPGERAPPRRIACTRAWRSLRDSPRRSAASSRSTGQPRRGSQLPARARRHDRVPADHERTRITVILTLSQPPLAQPTSPAARVDRRAPRLDIASASSKAYVATLAAGPARGDRRARRAIPGGEGPAQLPVLLNGMAVELPTTKLATLRASSRSRTSSIRASATRSP